jgi:hypothetical protein
MAISNINKYYSIIGANRSQDIFVIPKQFCWYIIQSLCKRNYVTVFFQIIPYYNP